MDPTTANQLGNLVTGVLGTGAQMYGQQNASEAVVNANQSAIQNQQSYLGNIGSIYSPYTTAGAGATSALASAEGLNGQPANYSGFENMPGYQFAINQGTQAIQRQAAASGNAYTPNTQAAVGQYVTGTAMQDYNTYIQQLQQTAGMGASAANSLGNITYNTGANTSQLMANTGQSQAGMYTGMGQTLGGALNGTSGLGNLGPLGGLASLLGGGGTGGTSVGGGLASLLGKGLSSLFGGSSSSPPPNFSTGPGVDSSGALTQDPNNPNFYDPSTDPNSAFNQIQPPSFDTTGLDTTDYSGYSGGFS